MKKHSSRHSHKHPATPRRNPEEEGTAECDHCGASVEESTLQDVDGNEKWCEECADSDAHLCEHEQKLRSTTVEVIVSRDEDVENWCEDCADNDATSCESGYRCGNYMIGDVSEEVDGNSWCPDCVQEHSAYCEGDQHTTDLENTAPVYVGSNESEQTWCEDCRDNSAYFCEVCDNYYDREHDHEDEDESEDSPTAEITGYHRGRQTYAIIDSPWARKQPKPLYFGVELEVIAKDGNRGEAARRVLNSIGPRYGNYLLYDMQEDGSLGAGGFEIITQPAGLDVHRERWFKADLKGLRGHDVEGCGMHIHFTRGAMKKVVNEQGVEKYPVVGRMAVFINSDANKTFMETFARRTFNSYAARVRDISVASGARQRGIRYEALNTTPSRTFEFRLPRSTTKVTTILATVEFVYMLIRFCEEASNTGLTVENFKKFVAEPRWAKETIFLRAYLVDRGLATAEEMKLPKKKPENIGSGSMTPVGSGSGPVRSNPGRNRAARGVGKHRDEDYYARWAIKEYRRTRKQED